MSKRSLRLKLKSKNTKVKILQQGSTEPWCIYYAVNNFILLSPYIEPHEKVEYNLKEFHCNFNGLEHEFCLDSAERVLNEGKRLKCRLLEIKERLKIEENPVFQKAFEKLFIKISETLTKIPKLNCILIPNTARDFNTFFWADYIREDLLGFILIIKGTTEENHAIALIREAHSDYYSSFLLCNSHFEECTRFEYTIPSRERYKDEVLDDYLKSLDIVWYLKINLLHARYDC